MKTDGPGFRGKTLEVGKGRVLQEGTDVCLLGYGICTNRCLEAAQV
jgi:1-deoxy-D-xylulose-5-phosphate synthase